MRRSAASVTDALNLDVHPVARYFLWLGDVLHGDFGISARTQQPVNDDLGGRLLMTLKLVTAATLLSIVVGISVGIVTALRQYSGFDYTTTFFTFVFFSLPVFWVAVILKAIGGINFNDWLRDGAQFPAWLIVLGAPRGGRDLLQRCRRSRSDDGWRRRGRRRRRGRDPRLHLGDRMDARSRVSGRSSSRCSPRASRSASPR